MSTHLHYADTVICNLHTTAINHIYVDGALVQGFYTFVFRVFFFLFLFLSFFMGQEGEVDTTLLCSGYYFQYTLHLLKKDAFSQM